MYPEPTGEVRMSLSLRFAAGSHKGMIREGNEDSGYAGPRLLAIADGMGGQAAGEVASSEVISTLVQLDDDIPGSDLLTSLGSAVQQANDQLRQMVEDDPQLEGMGTTLTALLWTGQRLGMVHVGDSRAYLLRDGALTQITQDHTWVQRLVDEGRITEEEKETHPQRSLLMRALDGRGQVEPDLSIREVRAGDRYLICSDGLSGPVSHQTLEETLAGYHSPHETVQELIQLALRGGGPDNITCIVADVLDVDDNDTLAGQLNDTPVVVGAVADSPPTLTDHRSLNTPAGRASGLGRPVPQQQGSPEGAFGPADPAAMAAPGGSFGSYGPGDTSKPRRKRRSWLKRSFVILLAAGVVGGALYGGYKWTQTQYYVGASGGHVAVYRGISQQLAGISLSDVYREHPDVELKYLPGFQRKKVEETIGVGSLGQADNRVKALRVQAAVCKKVAEAGENPPPKDGAKDKEKGSGAGSDSGVAGEGAGEGAGTVAASEKDDRKKAGPSAGPTEKPSSGGTGKPAPGVSLTPAEQKLAQRCGEGQ